MNFNFKKNNFIIILLLIFVILSCIVYFNMLNVKEGLTNMQQSAIQHSEFLKPVIKITGSDPNFNYYKLVVPLNRRSEIIKVRSINMTDLEYNTNSRDFSMNDISYNNQTIFSDFSFIEYHKKYGMFAFSDLSNARFYHYTNANSRVTLDLDVSTNIATNAYNFNMLLKEFSGNIYEPSSNVVLNNLSINIFTPNSTGTKELVRNGKFQPIITNERLPPIIQTLSGSIATATGGAGGSVTLGDTNLNLGSLRSLFAPRSSDLDNLLFSQLLQNGTYGSAYVPPIYNNFETAMNLPSNPIVNPVNSMNPLQYAESLFGPNITPVMAKNAYLNQNVDSATTVESSNNAMKAIRSPAPSFDTNGNLLAQNSSANVSSNRVNSSKNIATEDYPPCPAPQRCPEPNFDCKKVPKYEQGPDNPFLPRPVLTDFSTFGM
uniref:Uncharacterized protein n=1 Tax=viral metagenome TaxID=1070528 RepID=A0A6C0DVT0_9ZZZZ